MTYKGLKAIFDASAVIYDAVRPSYPQELIEAILHLSNLPEQGRILEIGCGTGKATLPFASRGCSMLCLEPGRNLAAIAAHNLREYPGVTIQEVTFEDWPEEEAAFDLVMAAQSFHWIPAEIGFSKAARSLKPTGSIALFWNLSPEPEGPDESLWSEVQQVYSSCAPELWHERGANPLTAQVRRIEEELKANREYFGEVVVRQFPWSVRCDPAEYIRLLNTYSNHLALPEERRKRLHNSIAQVIQQHGGSLLKSYLSVLMTAPRRHRQETANYPAAEQRRFP